MVVNVDLRVRYGLVVRHVTRVWVQECLDIRQIILASCNTHGTCALRKVVLGSIG